jgi:carboxyl-terminal processing protease
VLTAVEQNVPKTDLPVIVLVNGGTASAAEIVSGALQDARRATVLGETTFGTGTVLNQFNLSDGSAINVAVGEWLTPKGRVIWHHGIVPDVTVTLPSDVNPLTPSAENEMTPAQLRASGDTQLLAALDRLTKATAERAPSYWMGAK